MPKRRKEAKKKMSPKRRRTSVMKEQTTSNSVEADDDIDSTNAYSLGTASAAQVEPMASRPLTRSARKKKEALNTPSRIPLQNDDRNPSEEAATLLLVKQILFDSHRVDKGDHVPVEALSSKTPVQAKDAHSSDESICSDKTVDAQNDMSPSSQDETVDVQNDMMLSSKDELPMKNVLDLTVDAHNDMTPSSKYETVDVQNDMMPSSKDETADSQNDMMLSSKDKTVDVQNDMMPSSKDKTVDVQNDMMPSSKDETVDSQNDMMLSSKDETVDVQNDMMPSFKDELPSKNVQLDLKKFALDLLFQAQQSEPLQLASPCSGEIMININLPEEANVGDIITSETRDTANGTAKISEKPTSPTRSIPTASLMDSIISSPTNEVMSEPGAEDNFIDVQGYKMNKDDAPLVEAIFNKYGDIVKESIFSVKSRTCLLELVCSIYRRLDASKFTDLEPWELESMHGQVGDLELVKVDVGWLHRRLDQISKVQQLCEGGSTLKDIKARSVAAISEKQKAVQNYVKEFKAAMAAALRLQEKLQRERGELSAHMSYANGIINICDGSLVKGLV